MFVARGLVSQPKWQRLSSHWYVLVGSKSFSGARGLLWYPKHVVSAADTSQPRVQNIDFYRQNFSFFKCIPRTSEIIQGGSPSPWESKSRSPEVIWASLNQVVRIDWEHGYKRFCYGELDYDILEGSKGAFFSETPVVFRSLTVSPSVSQFITVYECWKFICFESVS